MYYNRKFHDLLIQTIYSMKVLTIVVYVKIISIYISYIKKYIQIYKLHNLSYNQIINNQKLNLCILINYFY